MAQGAEAPRRRAGLQPAAAHDERHRRLTRALAAYRLTIRAKQRLERLKLDSLDNALAELESRGREFERDAHAKPVDTKLLGKFEPVQQVWARLELAGPGRMKAGVDVRGDGSPEAYTGRLRRRVVAQLEGESAYDALRRAVEGPS